MHALLGGEGNSEGLRDYLLRRFRSVVSGYGATDVEIGLAAETPVTVALRRLALERREIAEALFGETDRVPMVFQYNPMLHHVETNARGELLFTVCRSGDPVAEGPLQRPRRGRRPARRRAAPPAGAVRHHPGVAGARRLRPPGPHAVPVRLRPRRLDRLGHGRQHLPGRHRGRHLRRSVAGRPRALVPSLAPGGAPGRDPTADLDRARARRADRGADVGAGAAIEAHLLATNTDYREAAGEYPELMVPVVRLFAAGTGPFDGRRRAHQASLPRLRSAARQPSCPVSGR